MEEIYDVVAKCYADFEKKLKSECKKRKWDLDFKNNKINSINGKDGRLFAYKFNKDYIDIEEDWYMRLDYGFSEWHYAPRHDECDRMYEAMFEGAIVGNDKEYPFSFSGELFHCHNSGENETSGWFFEMEGKDEIPCWDQINEEMEYYIVHEM